MGNPTYKEPSKEIEIIRHVDVLVAGGGPAGVGAAIGAAKAGADTMIIETLGSFGGMWTNGMVITLAGFNNWLRPYQRVVDGVMGEWIARANRSGGCENNRSWVLNSDPEIMKLVADEMLQENNVRCLLHTWVADVILDGQVLKGVIVENVDGRKAILAKQVIDCTGNGDVFARAGVPFHINNELQPMTMPFYLADVDPCGPYAHDEELIIPMGPAPGYLGPQLLKEYTSSRRDVQINRSLLKEASQKNELPLFGGPWFGGTRKRFPWVNTTRIYGNAVSANDLTFAEMEARKNVHEIVAFYKNNFEGFENAWVMKTSSTIGIRETRRLKGQYILTAKDILEDSKFNDSIALGTWPIDVHPPKGHSGMHEMYVPAPYQIPYRSLLPVGVNNLLVAGRCVSTEREAMGSLRVGATCGAIGHAAGVAAAIAAKNDLSPEAVDVTQLQAELMRQHGILDISQAIPVNEKESQV